MRYVIVIPVELEQTLRAHLFQSHLEQGAFLFARVSEGEDELCFEVQDAYLVPPEGWQVQHEVYLEMTDAERGKVMKLARRRGLAVIDCHSHPGSSSDVWFSPSDRSGISDFAVYAKWKLDGKPYAAMVWGEESVDGVVWHGDFVEPQQVDEVRIAGPTPQVWTPTATWHRQPLPYWLDTSDEE